MRYERALKTKKNLDCTRILLCCTLGAVLDLINFRSGSKPAKAPRGWSFVGV